MSKVKSLHIVGGARQTSLSNVSELHGLRQEPDGSLMYCSSSSSGDQGNQWTFLSSPIRVVALTRNSDGQNWGRLIEVIDPDGRKHRWAMPAGMLANHRAETYREMLLSFGVRLASGVAANAALQRYLMATVTFTGQPLPRARAASRLGWHEGAFVLPDRAIGDEEPVVYQSASAIQAAIRWRGSLEDWQNQIARPAEKNSRVALAICTAFAAPMLQPFKNEGIGIHFRGASSIGKTTVLHVAGSVWGGPCSRGGLSSYRQTWQATANGIEGMAEAHCDLPLCLDELGLIKADDAARVAYQLATGIGRARATKSGGSAPRLEWRVALLSTGEISLADKIAESKTHQRTMAGQDVRFIDIPADPEAGFGIFDEVSQTMCSGSPKDRGRALSDLLNDASQTVFGTAGPAFIEAFIADRESSIDQGRKLINEFVSSCANGMDGQVLRVAGTFGLIAAAGELATVLKVLPWQPGASITAARACFTAWLKGRGTQGSSEVASAIAHLRGVIERDGSARFQKLDDETAVIRDRIGFFRTTGKDTEYLIPPENWKALMIGRDPPRIARELAERGILLRDGERRPNRQHRLTKGGKPQRVYFVSHTALFADGECHD